MTRGTRRWTAWSWLGAATLTLACGESDPLPPAPGSGGSGSGGAAAGASAAGTPPTAGGGAASGTGGQAGGGGGAGGVNAGGGAGGGGAAGNPSGGGGAGAGGAGGAGGTAGSAGMAGGGGSGGGASSLPKRVLLYHFSTLSIASVPEQLMVLGDKLRSWGYEVEESDTPADINPTKLATFGAVGMINTCFKPFGANGDGKSQAAALTAFVESGGGLFGTHCAVVTFQTDSPPHAYNQLFGGRGGDGSFEGTSSCRTELSHPTTMGLGSTFEYKGNLDNADFVGPDTKVLVKCTWSGGAKKEVAVSWYRTAGSGRIFYTNFAKEAVDLKDATLGDKHILAGLGWVLGR